VEQANHHLLAALKDEATWPDRDAPGPLLQDIAAVTLARDLRDPRFAQRSL
jgi:hypothetical protein